MDQGLFQQFWVTHIMNGVTQILSNVSHPGRVSFRCAPGPDYPVMVQAPLEPVFRDTE
jgi:hypothetical protein